MKSHKKKNSKEFSRERALLALFITIVIFAAGITIGNYATTKKFEMVQDLSEQLQVQTLGIEVEYQILEENICENDEILYLTEDLFALSEKLDFMENSLGYDDQRVVDLKNYYFILQSKHWLLAKKRAETCNIENTINNTIVLYFYQNKDDCEQCQQQGAVLTYLRKKYDDMKIYSFDTDATVSVVPVLKKIYGLQNETPALVINDQPHTGYLNVDDFISFVQRQIEEDI